MTWCSEANARSRCVLAMLAIHRRFVDRFVGSRVPSHVSRRWVSRSWRPPSLAWVPAVPVPHGQRYYEGTATSGARIPDPLWFPFRVPHASPSFVLAEALPERRRTTAGPGSFVRPVLPLSGVSHAVTHRISQVPWRSIPHLCPVPRPRPDRRDLAIGGPADAAPGPNTPKAPAGT